MRPMTGNVARTPTSSVVADSDDSSVQGARVSPLLLVVLFTTAFPSNFAYYVSPLALLGWGFIGTPVVSTTRAFCLVAGLAGLTATSLLMNAIRGLSNSMPGVAFALVMWLPIIALLAHRGDAFAISDREVRRVVRILAKFCLLQAGVVAFQSTQTSNWDALAGTYGMFDFLGRITISQVMFTFNIFAVNLFLLAYWRNLLVKVAITSGFIAVAAAQSGHQTLFFIVTLLIVYGSARSIKALPKAVAGVVVFSAMVLYLFPATPQLALAWADRLLLQEFPKAAVVLQAFELVQDWKVQLLGTGLGQFSSRAALFASGQYLGVSLPDFMSGQSTYFALVMEPLLDLHQRVGEGSAIAQPYFSILTVVVEFGFVVLFSAIVWTVIEIVRARRHFRHPVREVRGLAQFQVAFLVFLVLCCTIENYLEFVQALTLPVLLYIFAAARLRYLLEVQATEPRTVCE